MEAELQEAIVCHELIHVRRRDWLNVLAEEAVRAVFWFHPAMWWLVGRIQLSREHVVDDAVIRLTESRDRYVEAMVAVATAKASALPMPATLFLRRRFLKRRVAHILQEATMTTRRLIASVTFSAAALYVAAALVVRAFPLEASTTPPLPAQHQPGEPVTVARGGDHLLHASLPEYPRRAIQQRVEGEVVLDVTIDERGEVSDARVLSGPEELRRAALESVLQWHYAPEKVRSTSAQVALRFTAPPPGVESEEDIAKYTAILKAKEGEPRSYAIQFKRPLADSLEEADLFKRQLRELEIALSSAELTDAQRTEYKNLSAKLRAEAQLEVEARNAKTGWSGQLTRIKTERLPDLAASQILGRAGVALGDRLDEAAVKRVRQAVAAYDEHLRVSFEQDGKGGVILFIIAP
jgi:TonB family protein